MTGVVVAAVVALAALSTSAYKNEQPGFRGTVWGVALPTGWEQTVRVDHSFGGINYYTKPAEDMTLGCANLKSVEYAFWQGKLSSVVVGFDGEANYTCVLSALNERFGQGVQPNQFIEKYLWPGSVTNILLQYNKITGSGTLFLASAVAMKEQTAWQKEQAKKGANQF